MSVSRSRTATGAGSHCRLAGGMVPVPPGKRSAAAIHRRASRSLGPSAAPARLPGVICPRRGHGRGRFRMSISQPPLMFVLMRVPLTRGRSRNPLAPLRFGRALPNRSLRFWAQSGAGSDPPPIVRSTAPESALMRVLISVVRGRSQPAPAARSIPAGRLLRTAASTGARTPHHLHHHGLRRALLPGCLRRGVPRALGRSYVPSTLEDALFADLGRFSSVSLAPPPELPSPPLAGRNPCIVHPPRSRRRRPKAPLVSSRPMSFAPRSLHPSLRSVGSEAGQAVGGSLKRCHPPLRL